MYCVYKKQSIITLKAAEEIVAQRLEWQEGEIYNGIAYVDNIELITPEAKAYMAATGFKGMNYLALIVNSKFKTLLGNLFITFDKPIIPTRMFQRKEDALKWFLEK
jgi:hypothetical protein